MKSAQFSCFLRVGSAAVLCALLACDTKATDSLGPQPPVPPDMMPPDMMPPDTMPIDKTEAVFKEDELLKVEIEIDPSSWQQLRSQRRDLIDVIEGEDCMDQPFSDPFTYFSGKVTVNGTAISNVGLKKNGLFGLGTDLQPSLLINFEKYTTGQEYSGLKRMVLNRVGEDPSAISQCLSYYLYRKAGLIAPRCNFARISVNGENLGIYSHVDEISNRFLTSQEATKNGTLWKGTFSDFREGWTQTFEPLGQTNSSTGSDKINALTELLASNPTNLLNDLATHLDVSNFITLWAMESLIWQWDGYTGNRNHFFLFESKDSKRLMILPEEVNTGFNLEHPFRAPQAPNAVFAQGYLAYKIYSQPEGREWYINTLKTLLDELWDENALLDEVYRMERLIRDHVVRENFGDGVDRVRDFIRNRRGDLQSEIDMGGANWLPELPRSICRGPRGRVDGEFMTTWGTHPTENTFETGSGTMNLVYEQFNLPNLPAGASAGMSEEDDFEGAVLVNVSVVPDRSGFPIVVFRTPMSRIKSGETIEIDRESTLGYYFYQPIRGELIYVGQLTNGSITLTEAGTSSSSAIVGRYDAEIF